jgi:hypothetical protein
MHYSLEHRVLGDGAEFIDSIHSIDRGVRAVEAVRAPVASDQIDDLIIH